MGILSAYDMTFEAALTKMMFVLEYSKDVDRRKQLLSRNLQGEMSC